MPSPRPLAGPASARTIPWRFLALMGGLATAIYAGLLTLWLIREQWIEAFAFGRTLLDAGWQSLLISAMLLGGLTMAMAARAARAGHLTHLLLYLALTIMCAVAMVGIRAIEYVGLAQAARLYPTPLGPAPTAPTAAKAAPTPVRPDPALGKPLYVATCVACHGSSGEGIANLGLPLAGSDFVRSTPPDKMRQFLRAGRQANDPASRMKALMPPSGGNPFLTDADLDHIVAYLGTLAGASAGASPAPATPAVDENAPRWVVPAPPTAAAGLRGEFRRAVAGPDPTRPISLDNPPRDGRAFFTLYGIITGTHLAMLIAGMGMLFVLLTRVGTGTLASTDSIDKAAQYWALTIAVGLVLFPFFHLAG